MAQHQLFSSFNLLEEHTFGSSPPQNTSIWGSMSYVNVQQVPMGGMKPNNHQQLYNNTGSNSSSPVGSPRTSFLRNGTIGGNGNSNSQHHKGNTASASSYKLSPELQMLLQQPNGILNQQQMQQSPSKHQSFLEKLNPLSDAEIPKRTTSSPISSSPLSSSPMSSSMEFVSGSPAAKPGFGGHFMHSLGQDILSPSRASPPTSAVHQPLHQANRKLSYGKNVASSEPSLEHAQHQHQHQHYHYHGHHAPISHHQQGSPPMSSPLQSVASGHSEKSHSSVVVTSDSSSPSSSGSNSPTQSPSLAPQTSNLAGNTGIAEDSEIVPFVEGTWKLCQFQHSQLLREFAVIPRKLVKKLVSMSEKENWGSNNEVLLNFLNYTFRRLVDERKIIGYFPNQTHDKYNSTKPIALCFNTGLLTPTFERVFCFLAPNKNLKEAFHLNNNHKKFVEWFVTLFVKESDITNKKISDNIVKSKLGCNPIGIDLLPKKTSYYCDKAMAKELVWNAHTTIESVNCEELIKNMKQNEKFFDFLQSYNEEELTSMLRTAISTSLKRAECNPRLAVAQYLYDKNYSSSSPPAGTSTSISVYSPSSSTSTAPSPSSAPAHNGEVQLLLPLDIDSLGLKCAVAVRISPNSGRYEIKSVLSLNQAYTNARLVQKVDQAWLGKTL